LRLLTVAAAVLLLAGFWTPVVGAVVGAVELWSAISPDLSHANERWVYFLLAILAAAIAMLGPGAWSIDARLFGRKHFDLDPRKRPGPH